MRCGPINETTEVDQQMGFILELICLYPIFWICPNPCHGIGVLMIPSISSPIFFKDLTSFGRASLETVVRQKGRLVEISVESVLPVGTAVSIESDVSLLLGHVISGGPGGARDGSPQSFCVVHLDQCLTVAQCKWPAWAVPLNDGVARKLPKVLV